MEYKVSKFKQAPYIYGAGSTGKKLASLLIERGIPPEAFIDMEPKTASFNGISIFSPENHDFEVDRTVIIAVFNRERNCGNTLIRSRLQETGFRDIISFEEFYQHNAVLFKEDFFWLTDPAFYSPYKSDIEQAGLIWTEEKSRLEYNKIIRLRTDFKISEEPRPSWDALQYLPKELKLKGHPINFIDIGAYDGDTLMALYKAGIKFNKVLAFEPDPQNFKKLSDNIKAGKWAEGFCLFPAGTGDKCSLCRFSGDQGEGSAINASSPLTVQIVALDEVVNGFNPDYIKMDVEGYEKESLCGMVETIKKHQPALAVSLYHKPQDIFELPLLVQNWYKNADFLFRIHGEHLLEIVMYVIPHRYKKLNM